MRYRLSGMAVFSPVLLVLGCFWCIAASVFAQDASISNILPRMQENVAALKTRTADFVCGEEVRKHQDFVGNRTIQRILYNVRYTPAASDGKSFRASPMSWEEIIALPDGTKKTTAKTSDKSKELFKEGNKILNGFDALFSWFDKDNEKCFDFELLGNETIEGRDVYKIRATAKTNVKRAGKICESFKKNHNSTIWVENETMQVVRLLADPIKAELPRIVTMLSKGTFFVIRHIDYAPVLVGKEYWWLPVTSHDVYKRDEQITDARDTEYRDYKLFTSSVKINFESLSK